MDKRITATQINVTTAKQILEIDWADGHHSVYPLDGLRKSCPCVECAGGHDLMSQDANPAIFAAPHSATQTIDHIDEVGNYAMQIFWGDGHNSGIYRWVFLRDLCPVENGILKA